ncbi:hypothetical protein V8E55_002823 [Tylopilus felleus]
MPPRLTFEYNPLSCAYPDDESDKDLFLQVSNTSPSPSPHRTVLLYWVNTVFDDGEEVWQVVRLHRHEDDGAHKYVYPDMLVVEGASEREHHQTFGLGTFSRDQREAVLECADDVAVAHGDGDGEGQQSARWMGELLERMVQEGLVARGAVDVIRDAVPLP